MSKIVIDARELRTTTGRYVERLLHYLQEVDSVNNYVVLLKPKDLDSWTPSNPKFQKAATPYKEFTFGEQLGLLRQISALKPDLVHFGMVQQPVLYHSKVVTTMHDLTTVRFRNPAKNPLVFTIKQQVYRWVNKRVARKSARIITPTEFVKHDVMQFADVPADKFVVTYEAADFIPDTPVPVESLVDKKFIMYIGRSQPHKNLPRLIEAFALLQSKHPNLSLALAGKFDATYAQIKQNLEAQGISNVIFTDFISDAQLRWMYEHAAVYAFPSLSEGFGLPALEAMIHGCPVASSNATCLPEVYQDGALYFDPTDPSDIATKIDEILSHPTLANELKVRGKRVAEQYSWQRMAEQTLTVYQTALEQD